MDFDERKRRVRQKLQETEKTDRISNLPTDILGHILSLLPTKYAVATTILSFKWKNLYKLTTNLDFNDSLSIRPRFRLPPKKRSRCFGNFVDRVLAQCTDSPITRFRLKCSKYVKIDLVTNWINVALSSYKVAELDLFAKPDDHSVLQLPELACQNLRVLKCNILTNCQFILHVPKLVTFPCLKVLFLKQVYFEGDSLNGILSGCPLLEELVIIDCSWDGFYFFFSNPLLRKLTLDVEMSGQLAVHFNLPSLVYLEYRDRLSKRYVINNLNSVVHALFEVNFQDHEFEDQEACNTMLDVIKGVSNCEILSLNDRCLEALTRGDFALPVFQNLTRLELDKGCYGVSWKNVLLGFLNKSPCLKSLTLIQEYYWEWDIIDDDDDFHDDQTLEDDCLLGDHPIPTCVSSCLKVIKLKYYRGLRGETDMVKYFLEKANALEQMVIHCRIKRNREREEEILKFPKASKTCSICYSFEGTK